MSDSDYTISDLAVKALLIERKKFGRNVYLLFSDRPEIKGTFWAWDTENRVHLRVVGNEIGGTWLSSADQLTITTADLGKYPDQNELNSKQTLSP